MPDCTGFCTPFLDRNRHNKTKTQACTVTISHPSEDWCQFTVKKGNEFMRLSIPMDQFFALVEKMDERMGA